MPHESTVAHEHEQRQSKEDANSAVATANTLEPVGEVQHNDVKDVSATNKFLFLPTLSRILHYSLRWSDVIIID